MVLVWIPALLAASALATAQDTGVGDVSFPNSGSRDAQPSFLVGLAQLHNFEYGQAAESFRRAQEIDPSFAMAYWGEAMTYNHPVWMEQDRDSAQAVLNSLGSTPQARLTRAATEREKDYLQAAEVLYGDGTKRERDIAHAEAMHRLHRKYPDDREAAALYSLAILGTAHEGRDFATYMRAAAVAEEVFRDHPRHPGILHYLIHSYDDPIHAPLGLRPARLYAKVAPGAAHAQHMTSHIFVAMGLWDDAVTANENAAAVANRARESRSRPPTHCGHYNFWLLYGYLQQGRYAKATKLLAGCREEATVGKWGPPVLDPDNSPLHSFLQMRTRYLLDTEAWDGEVARFEVELTQDYVPERITSEFAEGFAAARRQDLDLAREKLERLARAREALGGFLAENPSELGPAAAKRAEILEQQLRATLLRSAGNVEGAVSLLRNAAREEEELPFMFGPPFVDKPALELLGETLLELGRSEEALEAFERARSRTPERTAVLLGILRTATLARDETQAAEARNRLRSIWRRADSVPKELQ